MTEMRFCFNCGKARPDHLETAFHAYYESLKEEVDAWIQFEGWTELFIDPEKIRARDDEQLWFTVLCPECSSKLKTYLQQEAKA